MPPQSLSHAKAEFYDARYGLFLHYGLYSLLARHEWVQQRECIRLDHYAPLADRFTAERFDPVAIADLAVDAGMSYVNLTTRHHESFCLWDTDTTDFNSVAAPNCRRDLVAELADACRDRGLKLCLYLSHGRDWRHPHAPNNDTHGGAARPEYDPPEPAYATGPDHDLDLYLDYLTQQVTELLTQYGPIAAIWLDGIAVPLNPLGPDGQPIPDFDPARDGDPFRCQQLYDLIHRLQPACLVSYKQGYLGTEDFFAPEHRAYNRFGQPFGPDAPGEVCTTMTPPSWGFDQRLLGQHLDADHVWHKLTRAADANANLLLNTGPRPDGSLVEDECHVLREVGRRIASQGLPPRNPHAAVQQLRGA
jgi:alpha-L-fucosidase